MRRIAFNGIEYIWCDGAWIGYSDPWSPIVMTAEDMTKNLQQTKRQPRNSTMNPNLNRAAALIDTLENRMLTHAERMADFPTEVSQNDPEYLFHDWACGAYAKLHRDLYWMAANPVVVERHMNVLDNQIDISMDLEAYDLIAERMFDRAEQRGR